MPPLASDRALSLVNFCVRRTAQNLPRCASGGGVRGRRGTPLSPRGEKEEAGKEGRGRRLPPGPPTLAPGACRARESRSLTTSPRRRRASQGAAHTPAGVPRGRRDTRRRAWRKGPLTAASRAQQQHHHQGPHLCGRHGVAAGAAAGVWSSRPNSPKQDLPPQPSQAGPAAAVRYIQDPPPRLPGRAHARSFHPTPAPLPALPRTETRTRTRPRPAAGAVDATPSCFAGVRSPVASDEAWIPLPRNGTRRTCGSRLATLHPHPPRCVRQPATGGRACMPAFAPDLPAPALSAVLSLLSHHPGPRVLPATVPFRSFPPSRFGSAAWRRSPQPGRLRPPEPLPGPESALARTLPRPRPKLAPPSQARAASALGEGQ